MMKRTAIYVCLGVIIGLLGGYGIGRSILPGSPSTGGAGPASGSPRWNTGSRAVGYVLPNDGAYYNLKWDGVNRRLKQLGYDPQKYSAGGYKNVKAQTDIMENLIQKRVAGIILHAVDEKALIPFVERAYDAGIPVISENVEVHSSKVAGSVQLANEENGWELAMALVREMGGKGNIAALIGPPGLDVTDVMWKNAKEYLSRFP